MDISQNSTVEKRTLHQIQYEKNGPFAKFNSAYFLHFSDSAAPCFLEAKVSFARFLHSARRESRIPAENRKITFGKYAFGIFLHSKTADCVPNVILFLYGKTFIKRPE